MSPEEFKARHAVRYRKVMLREMTLADALLENDHDWRLLREARGA